MVPIHIACAIVVITTAGNATARMATYFAHDGASNCAVDDVLPPQYNIDIGFASVYTTIDKSILNIVPIIILVREIWDVSS